MNRQKIAERSVSTFDSILNALKKMDAVRAKLLFLMDDGRFQGLLTVGDVQRAVIAGTNISDSISSISLGRKIYARVGDSPESIRNEMLRLRAECMPVVDENNSLVDVYFWDNVFADRREERAPIDLPVVVMAGGQGTRLRPLTNVIPKPLIPIGEKTILETILDQFESIGCRRFYLSVNYKAAMIQYYLGSLERRYDVEYFKEERPMGTIGSVSLLRDKIDSTFFVSNCDTIIKQDYRDVYEYHKNNENDITLIGSIKDYQIPYGVVETGKNGVVTALKEKPQNAFMVNTGVYLLERSVVDLIPDGEFFHITTLIDAVRNSGGRVGCFPVSEKAWIDIGDWSEYNKLLCGSVFL